jgi:NitT/TauT family transport system substrate-binding protein
MIDLIKTAVVALTIFSASSAMADDTVTFGSIRVPVQVFIGMDKGFFAEQGITVDPVFYKSGAEIAPAIAIGQVDTAITTSGAGMFNAMARGLDITIVAEALALEKNAPGGDPTAIMIRSDLVPEGQAPTADMLKGHKIAVTAPGQILDITVQEYLRQNNLTKDDVATVGMAMPDMVPALSNAAVDGAIVIDPFKSMLLSSGKAKVLAESADVLPGASQAFLVYSQKMRKNSDLALRFLRAYVKTNRYIRENLVTPEGRKEIARIYQAYVPAKDASVYEHIALGTASYDAQVNVSGEYGLDWQLQTLRNMGLLQNDPNIAAHIDQSLLTQILSE